MLYCSNCEVSETRYIHEMHLLNSFPQDNVDVIECPPLPGGVGSQPSDIAFLKFPCLWPING